MIRSQANYFIQKNIRYEIVGEDHTVLTDAKWIAFIFNQLLSNAIKYTPDHGNIIDKGFTGRNGRLSKTHSTGLGLYLAKNLAEKLGIHLTAESTEGKGTTMTLFFPILNFYNEKR